MDEKVIKFDDNEFDNFINIKPYFDKLYRY